MVKYLLIYSGKWHATRDGGSKEPRIVSTIY
jgi:hypothetical protein